MSFSPVLYRKPALISSLSPLSAFTFTFVFCIIPLMKRIASAFDRSNFISYMYLPASILYFEVVLLIMAGNTFRVWNFIAMILISAALGTLFNMLSSLRKSEILNVWTAILILEIVCFIVMVFYFVQDTYQNFTNIETIFAGADGVLTEFGSSVINIATHNVGKILLYEAPVLLLILLGPILKVIRYRKNQPQAYLYLLILFLLLDIAGTGVMLRSQHNRTQLMAEYDFNTVVRCYGLQAGINLDLFYMVFGNPKGCEFLETDDAAYMAGSVDYERNEGLAEEAFGDNTFTEADKHTMDFHLSEVPDKTKEEHVRRIEAYVNSLTPSEKNAYTGLFAGKNLVFLTVESMSKEMISPEITPTLYQMQQEGICFEDYYQPYWNGSTSTGEFSNLMGIIPTSGMHSYESTIGKNLRLTIGNELRREGYYSHAYHNGTVEYYDRNIVHPNLGYDTFTAIGNGMEDGLSGDWPASDLEMLQYAIPQFISKSPFSIYFMTISGHFPYFHDLSVMVEKYDDRVAPLGYSDFVDAYLCTAVEVDETMAYLLEELKKNGQYENTVIVLAPDHYTYGLTKNGAWGTEKDYLGELFGYEPADMMDRDHNALIIWSADLAKAGSVTVTEPSYSVDILPTLLNLFGLEYDSRLLAGRDVLSETEGLVIWPDYSWRTSKGTYYALEDRFVSADGSPADPDYIKRTKAIVRNKMTFSANVLEVDYYNLLSEK